jgi:probable HAF family extracellular repeat protein
MDIKISEVGKTRGDQQGIRLYLCAVLLIMVVASAAFAEVKYTITSIPGTPAAINDLGQVVGTYNNQAFLWDSVHGIKYLGTLGGSSSSALGINNNSQIVGDASAIGNSAFHAFLYDNGGMHDILPGPDNSMAYGINEQGTIVGERWIGGVINAFTYSGGVTTPLGTGSARSINDNGIIVGVADNVGCRQACVFNGTERQLLGCLYAPNFYSIAYACNNSGLIVGKSQAYSVDGHWRPFLYTNNQMLDLGALNPNGDVLGRQGEAYGINDRGDVVGYSGYSAFLWSNGTLQDLNTMIDPAIASTVYLEGATDINNVGQIIGWGYYSATGNPYSFLLTPVPEPTTTVLLAVGSLGLFIRRQRK